jgi:plastocyanin
MRIVTLSNTLIAGFLAAMIAGPACAYEEGTVTGGGTIEGKIIYKGPSATQKVVPTKDLETCKPYDEALIDVGPDQAVQSAVIYLMDVKKGKAFPAAAKPPEISNHGCRFEPRVQVIRSGGPLRVANDDPVPHNAHGYYGSRTAFNVLAGATASAKVGPPGTIRVDCDMHDWMHAWIYVVDNPYYAITGADGKFSITDVPPGDYKLVAAQPYTGPVEQSVTVEAGKPTELTIELKKQ